VVLVIGLVNRDQVVRVEALLIKELALVQVRQDKVTVAVIVMVTLAAEAVVPEL
jgi:hypothetical protein